MSSRGNTPDAAPSAVASPARATARDRILSLLPFVLLAAAAVALRITLFPIETADVHNDFGPWFKHLRDHGHFAALKDNVWNYQPAYLYFLALTSYLPVAPVVGVKIIPVAFDVALACAFLATVADRIASRWGRIIAFAVPLFSPTLVLNGAAWGQCDVIYTTFVLLSLRAAMRDDWHGAMAFVGAAFSFKLQTVFFVPALGLMFLKARGPWRAVLWAPVVFAATLLPAFFIGRPLREMLTIYTGQVGDFHMLSLGAANVYQWLPNAPFNVLSITGFVLVAALLAGVAGVSWLSPVQWRARECVLLALLSCLLCPFFLPAMHDRYFLTADVLSLLLPFFMPRRWWLPLVIVSASALCYLNFIFGQQPLEYKYPAALMGFGLFRVTLDWLRAQGLPPILRAEAGA